MTWLGSGKHLFSCHVAQLAYALATVVRKKKNTAYDITVCKEIHRFVKTSAYFVVEGPCKLSKCFRQLYSSLLVTGKRV